MVIMEDSKWVLWKNDSFTVTTRPNPHIPKDEGIHLVIVPNNNIEKGWDDPELCGKTFAMASRVAKILIEKVKIVEWANLQYNGNWGFLPGNSLIFHIHIYGRKKSGSQWAQPLKLPKSPGTFKNEPLSEEERESIREALSDYLQK